MSKDRLYHIHCRIISLRNSVPHILWHCRRDSLPASDDQYSSLFFNLVFIRKSNLQLCQLTRIIRSGSLPINRLNKGQQISRTIRRKAHNIHFFRDVLATFFVFVGNIFGYWGHFCGWIKELYLKQLCIGSGIEGKIGDRLDSAIFVNTPTLSTTLAVLAISTISQCLEQSNQTRSIPCNVCVDPQCTRQSHLHYHIPHWNQCPSPNMFAQFSSSLFPKLSKKYQKENSFPRLAACSITVQWQFQSDEEPFFREYVGAINS